MAGLNCGLPSLAAWPTLRRGIDLFVSIEDRHAEEAVRLLWRGGDTQEEPPIEAGETGAAGLAGLMALLQGDRLAGAARGLGLGPNTCVLTLNTEGATDPEGLRRLLP